MRYKKNVLLLPLHEEAMGYRNNDTISEEIKKIVAETYVIGDAVKARKALDY